MTTPLPAQHIDPRTYGGFFDGLSHPVRLGTALHPGPFATVADAVAATGLPAQSLDDEVDGLAIQQALDSLPPRDSAVGFGGGVVDVPGDCRISRPVQIRDPYCSLVSSANAMIRAERSGFPMVMVVGRGKQGVPLGPSLVPGPGYSFTQTGDLRYCVPFSEMLWPLRMVGEGVGAFTVELFFCVDAVPQTVSRHLVSSYGALVPGRSSMSLGVWFECVDQSDPNSPEKIWVQGVIGGVTYQAYTSYGAFERGQVYHLALVYDGSAVSLYLGRPGEQGSRVLTRPASGLYRRKYHEDLTVGARPGRWPLGSADQETFKGAVDGFRLSGVANYSGETYAAPDQKPAVRHGEDRVVCNFDRPDGVLVGVDSEWGPAWVVGRGAGGGQGHGGVRVENLRLSGDFCTGLYVTDCQVMDVRRVHVNALTGFKLENNTYQVTVEDVKASCRGGGLHAVGNVAIGKFDGMDLVNADWGVSLALVDAYDMGVSNVYAFGSRCYVLVTGDDMTLTGNRWSLGNEASIPPDDIAVFGNCRNVSVTGFSSWFKDPVPPVRVYGGDRHAFYSPKIKASTPAVGPPCVFECPGQQPARPVTVTGLSRSQCDPALCDPPGTAAELD